MSRHTEFTQWKMERERIANRTPNPYLWMLIDLAAIVGVLVAIVGGGIWVRGMFG